MSSSVWMGSSAQVSALGVGRNSSASSSALAALDGPYPRAGVHPDFDFEGLVGDLASDGEARQMDALTRYAVACGALLGVEADGKAVSPERLGVILGTGFGCTASNHQHLQTLLAVGPRKVSPIVFRNTVSNAMAGHLAIALHAQGSSSVLSNGMVSGFQALAYAFEEIRRGRCDAVVAGAADCCSELVCARFVAQGERWGAPALPLMDGACLVCLRGDRPAEAAPWRLAGYGMGFLHAEDGGAALARVARRALDHAGFDWTSVDVLQLHSDRSSVRAPRDTSAGLEDVVCELLADVSAPPYPENTAVPGMLALAATLESVPAPGRLLFAALGADGNSVCLAMEHAFAGRPMEGSA